jgi:hypothetical protein
VHHRCQLAAEHAREQQRQIQALDQVIADLADRTGAFSRRHKGTLPCRIVVGCPANSPAGADTIRGAWTRDADHAMIVRIRRNA